MVLITCILTESVKKGLVSPKLSQYFVRRKLQLLKLNGSVVHVVQLPDRTSKFLSDLQLTPIPICICTFAVVKYSGKKNQHKNVILNAQSIFQSRIHFIELSTRNLFFFFFLFLHIVKSNFRILNSILKNNNLLVKKQLHFHISILFFIFFLLFNLYHRRTLVILSLYLTPSR